MNIERSAHYDVDGSVEFVGCNKMAIGCKTHCFCKLISLLLQCNSGAFIILPLSLRFLIVLQEMIIYGLLAIISGYMALFLTIVHFIFINSFQ